MEIRPVSYAEIFAAPNVEELFDGYAKEGSIPEIGSINPQKEMYLAMEKSGVAQCFGVYSDHLVGFASVLLTVMPHYGKKVATVESVYVEPLSRRIDLLSAVEEFARQNGCIAILWCAPAYSQFARVLSGKKSYRPTNVVFCRSL
jgi:GNAT superfamily N-acetyltransferase